MSDCTAALHRFYNVQVQPLLRTDIEFLGMNAMPEYKHPPDLAVTPRKYVDGKVLSFPLISFSFPGETREGVYGWVGRRREYGIEQDTPNERT